MIVTVFRSRLKPGVGDEYNTAVARMNELARTMPGYISHKVFAADDGERCTIVEFEHAEGMRAWRTPSTSQRRKWRGRNSTPSTAFRCARSTASRSSSRRMRPNRLRRPGLDRNAARRH